MKDNTVTCDGCGANLTTTGNSIDYRLELRTEKIPSGGGPVTDMWIEPELKHAHHFCRTRCLVRWVEGGMRPIDELSDCAGEKP